MSSVTNVSSELSPHATMSYHVQYITTLLLVCHVLAPSIRHCAYVSYLKIQAGWWPHCSWWRQINGYLIHALLSCHRIRIKQTEFRFYVPLRLDAKLVYFRHILPHYSLTIHVALMKLNTTRADTTLIAQNKQKYGKDHTPSQVWLLYMMYDL